MATPSSPAPLREIGRYSVYTELASGGMATVYIGRLNGPVGFARTVAIKRLHPQYAKDSNFVRMFLDEARLVARIHHPNVVQTLDVVADDGELFLVMEFVRGESLSMLRRETQNRGEQIPLPIVSAMVAGALHGLHAAHEATDEHGQPLGIVHRDVSPQNVLVSVDGVARVLDFGVAKAVSRLQETQDGKLKGKIAYMAPEQISLGTATRQSDIYAAGIVLWETLTGRALFRGGTEGQMLHRILQGDIEPPSKIRGDVDSDLEGVALKALSLRPEERFPTARAMAIALNAASPPATTLEVGEWVQSTAAARLSVRNNQVKEVESGSLESISRSIQRPEDFISRSGISHPRISGASAVRSVRESAPGGASWGLRLGIGGAIVVGLAGLAVGGYAFLLSPAVGVAPPSAPLDTAPSGKPATADPAVSVPDLSSHPAQSVPTPASSAPSASVPPKRLRPPVRVKPNKPSGPNDDDLDELIKSRR